MLSTTVPHRGLACALPRDHDWNDGDGVWTWIPGVGLLMICLCVLTVDSVAWVSVATYFAKNESLQWRLPLALACIGPLGLLCGIWFVPGQYDAPVKSRVITYSRLQNHPDICVGLVTTTQLCK